MVKGKKNVLNKVYMLNKQVFKYVVMVFFSRVKYVHNIVSLVLTDYGFVLPCMHFVHLAFLDHSAID